MARTSACAHVAVILSVLVLPLGAQPPVTPRSEEGADVTLRLPRQGLEIEVRKHLDRSTGTEALTATLPDGRAADYFAALRAERTLARLPAMKTAPALRRQLVDAGGEAIPVGIWLHFDPRDVDFREEMDLEVRGGAEPRAAKARLRERVARGNLVAVGPALAAIRSLGIPILRVSAFAPVIWVQATAAQVDDLAALPVVDRLYPSITHHAMTDDALRTHRWNRVHDFGTWGLGGRVAVLDDGPISTFSAFGGVNLVGTANQPPLPFPGGPLPPPPVGHATTCAMVIGSRDSFTPGFARGIEILSANSVNSSGNPSYASADLIVAADWAITNAADIVDCPFGSNTNLTLQVLDRYVDYASRFLGTTFTVAAGNFAALLGGAGGNVTSPGLAFNSITTGAMNDRDTPDWNDDLMHLFSSYADPISSHGDREKPEVVAEGVNVSVFNGVAPNGTSIAASCVAGMCGVFIQVAPILQSWPEAMKAVVLAASTNNIEGASRLSDQDGAGGVNGLQAYRLVENFTFHVGILFPTSFSPSGFVTRDIFLQGGDKTRVVLAWDSNANSSYSIDLLDADLDIAIFQGAGQTSGTVLASSLSFDNSYEIVEFCPPATGWYTVRINDFRFDGSSEFFGLAWTQDRDGRHAHFNPQLPVVTASDAVGPTIGNPAFRVDPADLAGANQPYLCLASLGIGNGFDFPAACRHSFGDVDFLTFLSADPSNPFFLGFAGVYDATGATSDPRLAIPDIPGLGGLTLYLTALTADGLAPDGVSEIAEFEPVTVWEHAVDLNLGDDGFTGPIALGFPFTFYGQTWTGCFINANGNITFGQGDPDFTESLFDLVGGPPRIAPLWDDLNMNIGGKIRYRRAGASQFVVEWVAVPEFGTTSANQNSVLLVLSASGTIEFKFGPCSLGDAIIGIAPGVGVNSTVTEFVNGYTRVSSGALFEWATGSNGLLFELGTTSPYRNKVRFRPSGGGYVATFEGP